MASTEGKGDGVMEVFNGLGAAGIGAIAVLFGNYRAALWDWNGSGSKFR